MQAMVFHKVGKPLVLEEVPTPQPGTKEVLIKVSHCGVCRTDLHILDGELSSPQLPLILGHEIVGTVVATGKDASCFKIGSLVGVPWLGSTCGECIFCNSGRENLCNKPVFTGYQKNGGYAEYTVADKNYCFPLPTNLKSEHLAPLLCAGLIGWRCLKFTGPALHLGVYGFGASAHIITQIAIQQGRQVYAFTRPKDSLAQDFARQLGAIWAGDSDSSPPIMLDAAIVFAPVGSLVPQALKSLNKGGILVLGGIHMSNIPAMPYEILWGERVIRSVSNLTRQDALEFLPMASQIKTTITPYALSKANEALNDLRNGRLQGAAVLTMSN